MGGIGNANKTAYFQDKPRQTNFAGTIKIYETAIVDLDTRKVLGSFIWGYRSKAIVEKPGEYDSAILFGRAADYHTMESSDIYNTLARFDLIKKLQQSGAGIFVIPFLP